jgi:hypothetical protein
MFNIGYLLNKENAGKAQDRYCFDLLRSRYKEKPISFFWVITAKM